MHIQKHHPFLKQAVGALIGVAIAYGAYIGLQELTTARASVINPSEKVVQQELLFPEPVSRVDRVTQRAQRALQVEILSRRLPPAILQAQVSSAKIERPTPVPERTPIAAPKQVIEQAEELLPDTPQLTESGGPLAGIFIMTGLMSAGLCRRKRCDRVC